MTPVNPLSIVNLMLVLASLLGTFFYLQLSQWLRDVLALRQKAELNQAAGDEAQKRAIVECRVEYRRLASWHTYAVNIVVVGFVVFVLAIGFDMIQRAKADPLYWDVELAFIVFFAVFLILTISLMVFGFRNAQAVAKILDPPAAGC